MDREDLKKYNFNFTKQYGQNFIFDHNLLRAIVADAGVEGKNVLEIGPGAGGLTSELCRVANKVTAYEIDKKLEPILSDTLRQFANVEIIFQDVMKAGIEDIEAHFDGDYTIVANLPYYITTPIIFKFLDNSTRLDKMVIMVQYEVAQRLVASPGTEQYGAITVALDCVADVDITRKVGRKNFVPAPNVDSAIVTIAMNTSKYDILDMRVLKKLIKSAFAMRRKTLANNIKKDFGMSADQVESVLNKCGFDSKIRGEALSTKDFVNLANEIFKTCKYVE